MQTFFLHWLDLKPDTHTHTYKGIYEERFGVNACLCSALVVGWVFEGFGKSFVGERKQWEALFESKKCGKARELEGKVGTIEKVHSFEYIFNRYYHALSSKNEISRVITKLSNAYVDWDRSAGQWEQNKKQVNTKFV